MLKTIYPFLAELETDKSYPGTLQDAESALSGVLLSVILKIILNFLKRHVGHGRMWRIWRPVRRYAPAWVPCRRLNKKAPCLAHCSLCIFAGRIHCRRPRQQKAVAQLTTTPARRAAPTPYATSHHTPLHTTYATFLAVAGLLEESSCTCPGSRAKCTKAQASVINLHRSLRRRRRRRRFSASLWI